MEREPMRPQSKSSNRQREEAVPEEPEEPSPEETLSQPGTGPRFDVSHNQVRAKKMDLVTQKKETKDLDDEYTKRHHMEQQILMEEKMIYHIEKDNEIYNIFSEPRLHSLDIMKKKINHIMEEINYILKDKFDEFNNDDLKTHLTLNEDVMDMEEKIMTVDQKN